MITERKKISGILLYTAMLAVLALPICTAQMSTNEMPKITIISPKEGATIPAGNVTIMVNITNFKLEPISKLF